MYVFLYLIPIFYWLSIYLYRDNKGLEWLKILKRGLSRAGFFNLEDEQGSGALHNHVFFFGFSPNFNHSI